MAERFWRFSDVVFQMYHSRSISQKCHGNTPFTFTCQQMSFTKPTSVLLKVWSHRTRFDENYGLFALYHAMEKPEKHNCASSNFRNIAFILETHLQTVTAFYHLLSPFIWQRPGAAGAGARPGRLPFGQVPSLGGHLSGGAGPGHPGCAARGELWPAKQHWGVCTSHWENGPLREHRPGHVLLRPRCRLSAGPVPGLHSC